MTRHYLWVLRPYFRLVAGELALGSLCGILANTLVVLPAIMLGRAIDTVLAFGRGRATAREMTWAALAFLAGTLATQGPRFGKRWWLMTANARIRADLRADALRGVLAWPMDRLHETSTGELMARIVADVEVLGAGLREFIVETWDTVLFSISLVVTLCVYDPGLSALVLLPVPLAMGLARVTGQWVRRRITTAREANADLTSLLQEQLTGLRVLKLFGRTGAGAERIEAQSRKLVAANLAVARLREGFKPVYSTVMVAGVVLLVVLGGKRVIAGAMSVGAFVAYMELYLRFTNRGHRIPQMVNAIQAGDAAYARLRPLLAPAPDGRGEPRGASFMPGRVCGVDDPLPVLARVERGPVEIAFERVSFRYHGAAQLALREVSLHIAAGAFVAITGPVGCGKSALLRALLGLYPLEQGEIRLDGRSLAGIPADEHAARIGYLPQDPQLFSGTVRENIAFATGCRGDEARIAAAVRTVILEPDLPMLPDGLESPIGERGGRVSGGQRQRIALARSLAATPSAPGLLLLDDPFSSVDLDTEARLIVSLHAACGPRAPANRRATILLSSHRLAAFPKADLILVLDHGRIVESGTHMELMAAGGLYARILHAQALVSQAAGAGREP